MQRGWKDASELERWGQICTPSESLLREPPRSQTTLEFQKNLDIYLISVSMLVPLCFSVERKPIMLFVFSHIYFYLVSSVLIFQRLLICYFICPPELWKEHQHCFSSAHWILGKDKCIWACGDLSSAPFPLCLLHAPPPPHPCLQKIFHLESDALFLPWSEQVGKCSQATHKPCPSY